MSAGQRDESVSQKCAVKSPDKKKSSPEKSCEEDSELELDDDYRWNSWKDSSYESSPAAMERYHNQQIDPRPPLHSPNSLLTKRASNPSTQACAETDGSPRKGSPSDPAEQKSNTPAKSNYINVGVVRLILLIVILLLYHFVSRGSTDLKSPRTSTGSISQFTKAFQNIKGAFPEQSKQFWTVLGAGTRSIVANENPERPAVFILVVPSDASDTADCLVRNISATITHLFNAEHPVEFTPPNVDVLSPEKIKRQLDDTLKEGLSSGSRVAVVHHLEHLPGESAGMLHAYCDDSNAPYLRVVYVLTLHVDELTSSIEESDSFARDRLKTLWGEKLGSNRFDPLLARIGGSITFVRPERSDILRQNMC